MSRNERSDSTSSQELNEPPKRHGDLLDRYIKIAEDYQKEKQAAEAKAAEASRARDAANAPAALGRSALPSEKIADPTALAAALGRSAPTPTVEATTNPIQQALAGRFAPKPPAIPKRSLHVAETLRSRESGTTVSSEAPRSVSPRRTFDTGQVRQK